jgi:signal transduction histidine kinase
VTTAMLSGTEEDDALQLVASRAREVADAEVAALVLPGWQDDWVMEVADGPRADQLIGTVMPVGGRSVSVVRSGRGLRLADMSTEPTMLVPMLRDYGPALYAPLIAGEEHMGVLVLLRPRGTHEFSDEDLATAQTFAGQAALALQLADGRRRSEEAEVLEERARIARDLHDLVVQELFAMGMRLSRLREGVGPAVLGDIDSSLDSLDRVVRQIRNTIRALREPEGPVGLVDRPHSEANRAHSALGFKPALDLPLNGRLDEAVPADIADDVVAVVREGLSNAARHARASEVRVRVQLEDSEVIVEVLDDGVGLPPIQLRSSGLDNLGERARRHGGRCIAKPRSVTGTVLRWRVPIRTC